VALLQEQDATREPDLVPVRHGRMLVSPFTFYRGAAKIMAADLNETPTAGLQVQLCGDAHLSNFGAFASPERRLLFDLNDFDETLPGPFEYDVKRMAASFTVAGRNNGFAKADTKAAKLAEKTAERTAAKARTRDSLQALSKLGELVDGRYRIVSQPPIVVPARDLEATYGLPAAQVERLIRGQFRAYRATLQDDRRQLLERFQVVDTARKVVGVGSVGTRAFIVLLQGRDQQDPLFLQVKEATASVLEDHLPKSRFQQHGERVVQGQRMMQAASDILLGWTRELQDNRHYYWRQLRDMKGSVDVEALEPVGLNFYAGICGWTLARAHARSGDPVAIAAYLGEGDHFDRAVTDFAERYADQNERDYQAFTTAIRSGRLHALEGL